MDFSGFQEKYNKLLRDRSLNPNDPIDQMVFSAYMDTKHLTSRQSRVASKDQAEVLLRISEQAEQLSLEIKRLHYRYREGISFSLIERESCNITSPGSDITDFLNKLSRAAIHANDVMLNPVPEGKYNAFLFLLVERYLQSPSLEILFSLYPAKTELKKKNILKERWEKNRIKIIEKAATIISYELGTPTAKAYGAAKKTIENNISSIVNERIEWALMIQKIIQGRRKKSPKIP